MHLNLNLSPKASQLDSQQPKIENSFTHPATVAALSDSEHSDKDMEDSENHVRTNTCSARRQTKARRGKKNVATDAAQPVNEMAIKNAMAQF